MFRFWNIRCTYCKILLYSFKYWKRNVKAGKGPGAKFPDSSNTQAELLFHTPSKQTEMHQLHSPLLHCNMVLLLKTPMLMEYCVVSSSIIIANRYQIIHPPLAEQSLSLDQYNSASLSPQYWTQKLEERPAGKAQLPLQLWVKQLLVTIGTHLPAVLQSPSHQDEFTPAPWSNSGFEHFTLSSSECTHRCASTHAHTHTHTQTESSWLLLMQESLPAFTSAFPLVVHLRDLAN